MTMTMTRLTRVLLTAAGIATAGSAAANHHFMQIEQVIGGVNGDTSAQAVQLRMRSFGQNLVSQGRLIAYDAAGQNPVILIDFTSNVANGGTGDRVLVTTAAFGDYTDVPLDADFIMTNPIPVSYLAAGRITFEDDLGTIWWSLAWGGSNYTGDTTGALTNDDDGDFGPPWPDPLPSDSLRALQFQGGATAQSTTNADDYALSPDPAVFINNAGEAFTLVPGEQAATITGFEFVFGNHLDGGVADLESSDDARLSGRSQFGFSATEPNILGLVVTFDSPTMTPTSYDITVEGFVNNPGDTTRLRLFNFKLGEFELIQSFTLGQEETVHEFNDVAAQNRVDPSTGEIQLSLRTIVVATFGATGFDTSYDHTEILVAE